MNGYKTALVKYVYLDIVDYTKNRSVEAQSDIIHALNRIVIDTLKLFKLDFESVIFMPTGDGVCISIFDKNAPYDIHIQLSLAILKAINEYNERTDDEMRQFKIRIGVNENTDNMIVDINDNKNLAGAGINYAQRIMSVGDAGTLIVGNVVFETLSHRERYMGLFNSFNAEIKHGLRILVHQFIEEGNPGLCLEPQSRFSISRQSLERRFTLLEAYYLAHAISNCAFLIEQGSLGQATYSKVLMLWFLAQDSAEIQTASDFDQPSLKIYGKGKKSIKEIFTYYESMDFWLCTTLASYFRRDLNYIEKYLETPSVTQFFFVNSEGKTKLSKEYPEICEAFGIEAPV